MLGRSLARAAGGIAIVAAAVVCLNHSRPADDGLSALLLRPSVSQGFGTYGGDGPRGGDSPQTDSAASDRRGAVLAAMASLPLAFERNDGQTDPRVRFLARGADAAIFVLDDGLVLAPRGAGRKPLRLSFHESAARAVEGVERLPGVVHHLKGNDPKRWRRDVPLFAQAVCREAWPGIDVVFHGNGRQVEYDFAVAPGVDPSAVALRFDGADSVAVNASGDLVVTAASEEFRHLRPRVFERDGDVEREIAGAFVVHGDGLVGFRVEGRDPARPLVIDPVIAYATYLGGKAGETALDVFVDSSGDLYLTGTVASTDFPLANGLPGSPDAGGADAFVTKLIASGARLLHSTYLGGNGSDAGWGVRADATGAYVAGSTTSPDFFSLLGYQSTFGGGSIEGDAFLVKLTPSGSDVVYATFLGGSGDDGCRGLAVDSQLNAYVGGFTNSVDFPTTASARQRTRRGSADGWVAKFGPTGAVLEWSTYLGGSTSPDEVQSLAVNGSGNLYAAGFTASSDFPIAGGFQPSFGGGTVDGFVARFNAGGDLAASTFLGGVFDDNCRRVALDFAGNVYVAGFTLSYNFPTHNPLQSALRGGFGTGDAFVAEFDAGLSSLVFSTYLGGNDDDDAQGLAVAPDGSIFVAGNTTSTNFPTSDPTQAAFGGTRDAFVTKLAASGASTVWSTYIGGSGYEAATAVATDAHADAYVAVAAASASLPTTCAAQPEFAGGERDIYVIKLTGDPSTIPAAPLSPSALVSAYRVDFMWVDASRNECAFRVERSVEGGPFAVVATLDANATAYQDHDVVPDRRYSYRVVAVSPSGESAPTEVLETATAQSIVISQRKGVLTESAKARRDRIKVSSVMRFDVQSADQEIRPTQEDVEIAIGSESDPFVLRIAAGDPAWKKRGRTFRWRSPKKTLPIVIVDFVPDPLTPALTLTVSRLDFPTTPQGAILLGLRCGNDAGHVVRGWTAVKKRPGKFRLP